MNRVVFFLAIFGGVVTASAMAAPEVDYARTPAIPEGFKQQAQEAGEHFSQGRYKDAATIYLEIIQHHPDSLYAWSNLGVLRVQQKQWTKAEAALRRSIQLCPKDGFSYSALGQLLFRRGRYHETVRVLQRGQEISPNDARLHFYLGRAAYELGKHGVAEEAFRKAHQLDPRLPVHNYLKDKKIKHSSPQEREEFKRTG